MTRVTTQDGKVIKKKKLKAQGNVWVYIAFLALPVIQCLTFTVGVYLNSFKMAFHDVDPVTNTVVGLTFNNFVKAWEFIQGVEFQNMVEVSLTSFFCHIVIGVPLGVCFAYYMAKKKFLYGFFRVTLFVPSIIPAIVLVTIYKYFVDRALPAIFDSQSMFDQTDTSLIAIIFYNIFIGFGASVLMYTNKMAEINPSLSEAASLDGATPLQDFWHIALPATYSTISVFLYTSIASIFLDQMNLFSFYGWQYDPNLRSIGYYFYYQASEANTRNDLTQFAYISAVGMLMTVVAIPLTFITKKLLEKYGPSEE